MTSGPSERRNRLGLPGWCEPLVLAMQFLTRIPMPDLGLLEHSQVGRSLLWYPAVGGLIGTVLWLAQLLLQALLPDLWSVQAGLLLLVWCLLTGGLHLDGLADSADAWAGGLGDRARSLELMKDPTCGPAAVMVLVLVLLVKFSTLAALIATAPGGLIVAPLVARALLLLLFLSTDYVRAGGLGEVLSQYFPRQQARYLLAALVLLLVCFGASGILVLLCSLLLFAGLRLLMCRRLGGTTGDTAGALVELSEAVVLLALLLGG
ncbi:MAG: adenosylcobinamide-GDP ribazoletransferase [Motiliproteus sp.]|jgi:adenosylcobinamide-GDP ribazoletransferase